MPIESQFYTELYTFTSKALKKSRLAMLFKLHVEKFGASGPGFFTRLPLSRIVKEVNHFILIALDVIHAI